MSKNRREKVRARHRHQRTSPRPRSKSGKVAKVSGRYNKAVAMIWRLDNLRGYLFARLRNDELSRLIIFRRSSGRDDLNSLRKCIITNLQSLPPSLKLERKVVSRFVSFNPSNARRS